MQKQLLYATLMPRIFSTLIDVFLVSLLLLPVINFINQKIIISRFHNLLMSNNIDLSDMNAIRNGLINPDIAKYIHLNDILYLLAISALVQTLFLGVYFIFCWTRYGTTPVRYIMRMKLVSAKDFEKMTMMQAIIRFISTITFPIGVLVYFFNKQNQMIHDKFAKTLVVKI
jgi:uncharacterized RDD family membrane protein YckC